MRVIIQRVNEASVTIEGKVNASITTGLLVLAGFEDADNAEDLSWMSKKIINLRIFNDANHQMNLSVQEVGGGIIIVSQFTLHALTKKGNRPSFIRAARPEVAIPLYEAFVKQLETDFGKPVGTGQFVTIIIDSKNKE
jgi:D-tyrosyl-tRNA(Tyr) deacylase